MSSLGVSAAGTRPGVPAMAARQPARAAARALLRANRRYWTSVTPWVRMGLARWQRRAGAIPDAALRRAALHKLTAERFNVEVAATLATLAPRRLRPAAIKAIVALQIAYDYLDLLSESPALAGGDGGRRLLLGLASAIDAERTPPPGIPDGSYLHALLHAVGDGLAALPSTPSILGVARGSAERCVEAQALNHASASASGERALRRWASERASGSRLGWREHAAGSSASVLCLHALIAAAAQRQTCASEAVALDRIYIAVGALTMLDSLLDQEDDRAAGIRSWPSRYRDEQEMAGALAGAAAAARTAARQTSDSGHHLLTMAGVIAYYASARPPGLRRHDPIAGALRGELGTTLAAPMLVMRLWRSAKAMRRALRPSGAAATPVPKQALPIKPSRPQLIAGHTDVYGRSGASRAFGEGPRLLRGQARR